MLQPGTRRRLVRRLVQSLKDALQRDDPELYRSMAATPVADLYNEADMAACMKRLTGQWSGRMAHGDRFVVQLASVVAEDVLRKMAVRAGESRDESRARQVSEVVSRQEAAAQRSLEQQQEEDPTMRVVMKVVNVVHEMSGGLQDYWGTYWWQLPSLRLRLVKRVLSALAASGAAPPGLELVTGERVDTVLEQRLSQVNMYRSMYQMARGRHGGDTRPLAAAVLSAIRAEAAYAVAVANGALGVDDALTASPASDDVDQNLHAQTGQEAFQEEVVEKLDEVLQRQGGAQEKAGEAVEQLRKYGETLQRSLEEQSREREEEWERQREAGRLAAAKAEEELRLEMEKVQAAVRKRMSFLVRELEAERRRAAEMVEEVERQDVAGESAAVVGGTVAGGDVGGEVVGEVEEATKEKAQEVVSEEERLKAVLAREWDIQREAAEIARAMEAQRMRAQQLQQQQQVDMATAAAVQAATQHRFEADRIAAAAVAAAAEAEDVGKVEANSEWDVMRAARQEEAKSRFTVELGAELERRYYERVGGAEADEKVQGAASLTGAGDADVEELSGELGAHSDESSTGVVHSVKREDGAAVFGELKGAVYVSMDQLYQILGMPTDDESCRPAAAVVESSMPDSTSPAEQKSEGQNVKEGAEYISMDELFRILGVPSMDDSPSAAAAVDPEVEIEAAPEVEAAAPEVESPLLEVESSPTLDAEFHEVQSALPQLSFRPTARDPQERIREILGVISDTDFNRRREAARDESSAAAAPPSPQPAAQDESSAAVGAEMVSMTPVVSMSALYEKLYNQLAAGAMDKTKPDESAAASEITPVADTAAAPPAVAESPMDESSAMMETAEGEEGEDAGEAGQQFYATYFNGMPASALPPTTAAAAAALKSTAGQGFGSKRRAARARLVQKPKPRPFSAIISRLTNRPMEDESSLTDVSPASGDAAVKVPLQTEAAAAEAAAVPLVAAAVDVAAMAVLAGAEEVDVKLFHGPATREEVESSAASARQVQRRRVQESLSEHFNAWNGMVDLMDRGEVMLGAMAAPTTTPPPPPAPITEESEQSETSPVVSQPLPEVPGAKYVQRDELFQILGIPIEEDDSPPAAAAKDESAGGSRKPAAAASADDVEVRSAALEKLLDCDAPWSIMNVMNGAPTNGVANNIAPVTAPSPTPPPPPMAGRGDDASSALSASLGFPGKGKAGEVRLHRLSRGVNGTRKMRRFEVTPTPMCFEWEVTHQSAEAGFNAWVKAVEAMSSGDSSSSATAASNGSSRGDSPVPASDLLATEPLSQQGAAGADVVADDESTWPHARFIEGLRSHPLGGDLSAVATPGNATDNPWEEVDSAEDQLYEDEYEPFEDDDDGLTTVSATTSPPGSAVDVDTTAEGVEAEELDLEDESSKGLGHVGIADGLEGEEAAEADDEAVDEANEWKLLTDAEVEEARQAVPLFDEDEGDVWEDDQGDLHDDPDDDYNAY